MLYTVHSAFLVGTATFPAAAWNLLTVTESRYGLGLPLKQRPAANYLTYTKVNIFLLHFSLMLRAYYILLAS